MNTVRPFLISKQAVIHCQLCNRALPNCSVGSCEGQLHSGRK